MCRYRLSATGKGPAHILAPLFERQLALGTGISDPVQQPGLALDIQCLCESAGDFMGLVKAALTQAQWMQWNGDQAVWQIVAQHNLLLHPAGKKIGKLQLLVKFETGDAAFDRSLISIKTEAVVRNRRLLETRTADLRRFQWHRTAMTGRTQQWQLRGTGLTKRILL